MKTKLAYSICAMFAVLKFRTRRRAHIAVEGKVSEPFGETGGDWLKIESEGKKDNN